MTPGDPKRTFDFFYPATDLEPRMSNQEKISIEYPIGTDDAAIVTFVGGNTARLETDPWSFLHAEEDELDLLPEYRDVVELKRISWRRRYRFVRVLERADYRTLRLTLSQPAIDRLEPLLSDVIEAGGNWEVVLSGFLTIFLPRDSKLDAEAEVSKLLGDLEKPQHDRLNPQPD